MTDLLPMIEQYWPVIGVVLLLALLIVWWLATRSRPAQRRRAETPDVLTPGAAPAQRNTLLVEAPPAASWADTAPIAATMPDLMGGMGEAIAVATAERMNEVAASDAPEAAPVAAADDLTRIKGLGPKLNARLGELGIRRYDQIAAWTDEDVARIDPQLGAFQGRIVRDGWIEQCRFLASGDLAGYEARYGKV